MNNAVTKTPAPSMASPFGPAGALGPAGLAGAVYRRNPIRALRAQLEEQVGRSAETVETTMQMLVAECDLRAYEARNASAWWGRAYYLLGAPAALLATVAGATALSDAVPSFVISVLALASAGLTTLVTFFNTNSNRDRNLEVSAAWSELADRVRVNLLNYAAERCVAGAVEAGVHHKYSRVIVDMHARKAMLLRGEIPSAQSAGAS
jgi:hypothetical protein